MQRGKQRWVLGTQPAARSWWAYMRDPQTGQEIPTPREGFTARAEEERPRMSNGRCASAVLGLQREGA